MIHLFEQYPKLKEKLPYIKLGEFPTPVKHLINLGKEIGTDSLYLKHDGLSSQVYGGNKIRKLEFLLGDAIRKRSLPSVLPDQTTPSRQRSMRRNLV